MKKKINFAALLFCFFWLLSLDATCRADSFFREDIGEHGYIDWLSYRVVAKGMGLLPQERANEAQAKAMAQRAAMVVAQRNLLAVIKGVHIDSTTRVENRMAQDDTIVARIEGVVKFCRVEQIRMIDDRSVEMVVSMPITGKLAEILINVVEDSDTRVDMTQAQGMELRLNHLENRVKALEQRVADLKKISMQQEDFIHLFQIFFAAWHHHLNRLRPMIQNAEYASGTEVAAIQAALIDQEKRLASLAVLMDDLSSRLATLEDRTGRAESSGPPQPSKESYPYTGLIVDARSANFKPCLKPSLFIDGEAIYPGDYVDLKLTVKEGYVRYYSDLAQAQRSERIGTLPYVVKASTTFGGDRGLSIDGDAHQILRAVLMNAQNFLAQARVVIVF